MSQIIKKYNFKFNKSFGQNFIFDTNLLKSIVLDAGVTLTDEVLEIGTGAATLTKIIAENCKKIISYEIDENLKPIINENLENINNATVVFKDIMKEDIKTIESNFNKEYRIVANLPYYITTPIIFKFVENATKLKSMAIMVQKEVANRLVALPSTADYGAITVAINAIGNVCIKRIVKRNMFVPAPNVDSAIVRIDIDKTKYNIENIELFKKVVKSAFNMRRKTLANNLKSSFGLNYEQIYNCLTNFNLNVNIRGEALSTLEFVNISNYLNKIIN